MCECIQCDASLSYTACGVLISEFNGTHMVNLSKFLSILSSRLWMVTDGVHHVKC